MLLLLLLQWWWTGVGLAMLLLLLLLLRGWTGVGLVSHGPRGMMRMGGMGRRHTHMLRRRRDGTQGGSTTLCCLLLPPGAAILSTLGLGLATAWHGEGYVAENLKYVSTIEGQR